MSSGITLNHHALLHYYGIATEPLSTITRLNGPWVRDEGIIASYQPGLKSYKWLFSQSLFLGSGEPSA